MKKTLLATVAIAAVVGFASLAAAQAPAGGEAGKGAAPAAAPQEQKANPGGTVTHQPLGGQPAHKSINPTGQSAQGAPGTTPGATLTRLLARTLPTRVWARAARRVAPTKPTRAARA